MRFRRMVFARGAAMSAFATFAAGASMEKRRAPGGRYVRRATAQASDVID